ncbi:MAG: hypothetical protein AB7U45_03820 [Desulfamplus sp.]
MNTVLLVCLIILTIVCILRVVLSSPSDAKNNILIEEQNRIIAEKSDELVKVLKTISEALDDIKFRLRWM